MAAYANSMQQREFRAARGPRPLVAVQVPDPEWQESLMLLLDAADFAGRGFTTPEDLLDPPFATASRRVVLVGGRPGRAHQVVAPVAALRASGVTAPILLLAKGPVEPPLACRLMALGETEALENLAATSAVLDALRTLACGGAGRRDAPISPLARRAIGMMLAGRSRRTIASALALRLGDLDTLVAQTGATLAAPGMVALLRAGRDMGLQPA